MPNANKSKSSNSKKGRKFSNATSRSNGKNRKSEMEGKNNNKFKEEDNRGNTSGANSTDWYGGSSPLMANAANISFQTGVGRPIVLNNGNHGSVEFCPSGIMTFYALNNVGVANDWNSPVNLAARHLYTFVRHVNSGHSNYDAVDMMMYITLMDNAFSYWAWMVRVYGTMSTVLLRNRYTPHALVHCMGADYNDLSSKLADFRYYINLFATRINQMAAPRDISLFQRHMWMYSNIYADAPTEKAQFYLFNPVAFWQYTVTDIERYLEPRIQLDMRPTSTDMLWSLADIVSNGDLIINQILQREDFNIMSGDIMKAYGESLFKLTLIAEEYKVAPVYDPEILMQIHNMDILNVTNIVADTEDYESWKIKEVLYDTADAGAMKFAPMITGDHKSRGLCGDMLLDMPMDAPTSANIAAATRLKVHLNGDNYVEKDGVAYVPLDAFSTEIILQAAVYKNLMNGGYSFTQVRFVNDNGVEHFEMRPLHKLVVGETFADAKLNNIFGDLTNYAVLDLASLQNINEAAALALYGIA